MATLEVFLEKEERRLYELVEEQTVAGRYEFCNLYLRCHTISRQHARFTRVNGQFYVEDLSSLNGTFVNGKKIEERTLLKDQDRVHLYKTLIVFHACSPAEIKSPPQNEPAKDEAESAPVEDSPERGRVVTSAAPQGASPPASSEARFRAALKITQSLGDSTDLDEILPKILDSIFEIFPQADRGYILLAEQPDGILVPRAIKHRRDETGHSMTFGIISRRTASRVMSEGKAVLIDDASGDAEGQSVFEFKSLSLVCAPLIGPSRQPLGIIYVDTRDPQNNFTEKDLDVLVTVATIAGQSVEYAGEHEAAVRLGRRKLEWGTAKEVQRTFLPQNRPNMPGYKFYDYYLAADEIGGDYFGYIPLPDGRLALAVGDVAGKGVSAALLMAHLCSEVRYCLTTSATPADAVNQLNINLSAEALNYRFVTFVLCVIDPRKHRLTVVNAGHMPPLRRCGDTHHVEEIGISVGGLPLGCDVQKAYAQVEIDLEPGDMVFLFTDGITEAMNPHGEVYGLDSVRSILAQSGDEVAAVGEALVYDVKRFVEERSQSDDICVVGFERNRQ